MNRNSPTQQHLPPIDGLEAHISAQLGRDAFLFDDWTDDLRPPVRNYLLNHIPTVVHDSLCDELLGVGQHDGLSPHQEVDRLVEHHNPQEIVIALHDAIVCVMPTLEALLNSLLGHHKSWQDEDDQIDTVTWLSEHASAEQLADVAIASNHTELLEPLHPDLGHALVHRLKPRELLAAWEEATGPAPSDLTDAEWRLIVPFIPTRPWQATDEKHLLSIRQSLSGMIYRLARQVPWRLVPRRYGTKMTMVGRYTYYRKRGIFAQMQSAFAGNAAAGRILSVLQQFDELEQLKARIKASASELIDLWRQRQRPIRGRDAKIRRANLDHRIDEVASALAAECQRYLERDRPRAEDRIAELRGTFGSLDHPTLREALEATSPTSKRSSNASSKTIPI